MYGTFQLFIPNSGVAIITTPQGEDDPDLQTVHYVTNYEYIATGTVPPVGVNDSISLNNGELVKVYFGTYNVPGNTDDPWTLTGTITAINPSLGVIELDVGGVLHEVKDFWYIEKL